MLRRLAIIVCMGIAIGGCGDDDEGALLIDVRTDYRPGVDFTRVRVEAGPADGSEFPRSDELAVVEMDPSAWLAGQRVTELTGLPVGSARANVSLLRTDGASIGQQQVRFEYAGQTVGVTLVISRDCAGVTCPPTGGAPAMAACLSGMCADEACSPENLAACPAPACTADGDCGAGLAACASGQCIAGRCFASVDDSVCGGGVCDPVSGCTGADAGMDGSVPDAAVDAADDAAPDTRLGDSGMGCSERQSASGTGSRGIRAIEFETYYWRFGLSGRYCIEDLAASLSDHPGGSNLFFDLYSLSDADGVPVAGTGEVAGGAVDPGTINVATDVTYRLTTPVCLDPGWYALGVSSEDTSSRLSIGHTQEPGEQEANRTTGDGVTTVPVAGARIYVRGCNE